MHLNPRRVVPVGALAITILLFAQEESTDIPDFDRDVRPLLQRHCFRCHAGDDPEAGLNLERLQPGDAASWSKVWAKVDRKQMPPPSRPPLSDADRMRITGWIETSSGRLPSGERDPGRVVARRLSRVEYRNTIRDLMGIDYAPAGEFPADDIGYGFDSIGDVLSIPPLLLERYLQAARAIVDHAVVTPEQRTSRIQASRIEDLGTHTYGRPAADRFILFAAGEIAWQPRVPLKAEYILRVRASAQQAGPETARLSLRADGALLQTFEVPDLPEKPGTYEARVTLTPGAHALGAGFTNDYYNPDDPDPAQRDRNLFVHGMELEGPIGVELPPAHRAIFISNSAERVLSAFLRRAFRRPATKAELDRYLLLFKRGRVRGESFESAMKPALMAALTSPQFLFRVEGPGGPRPVNDFELASRLSYFLWSSMPDEALLSLAERGELRAALDEQVRRMIEDPRSAALAENFGRQWLQTRRLEVATPDPSAFPRFGLDLREAMDREPVLCLESILREDRSLLELIDANYTFLNERLAAHYEIEGVSGAEMRRVRLTDNRRGGLLSMAAILTINSTATRTSPSKRGKWVLETLLGTPPPPPIPNAPSLRETGTDIANLPLRERLRRHREDPICASCHREIDPIGFSFEHYDGLGAWRDREAGAAVDASAKLPDGTAISGVEGLKKYLLARRRDFVRCLTEKLMTFALGRGLEPFDAPTVRDIVDEVERRDWRSSALLRGVIRSYPFLNRRTAHE